jgi:hypothetical protein
MDCFSHFGRAAGPRDVLPNLHSLVFQVTDWDLDLVQQHRHPPQTARIACPHAVDKNIVSEGMYRLLYCTIEIGIVVSYEYLIANPIVRPFLLMVEHMSSRGVKQSALNDV